jgi:hypothetical protein
MIRSSLTSPRAASAQHSRSLPDQLKTQWQMAFPEPSEVSAPHGLLFEKAGEVLPGYSSVNTILDAVQRNKK